MRSGEAMRSEVEGFPVWQTRSWRDFIFASSRVYWQCNVYEGCARSWDAAQAKCHAMIDRPDSSSQTSKVYGHGVGLGMQVGEKLEENLKG